mgnify:CR=1 FL=1
MKKTHTFQGNFGSYIPMLNQKGLRSFLTPFFAGHLVINHDRYILEPTSERSLYQPTTSRNVLFYIDGNRYDLNAMLNHQINEPYEFETGHAYQKVTRKHEGVSFQTLSFLPLEDPVELHHMTIKKETETSKTFKAITAVELYGRSAENQRDHRHVTSLLNQIHVDDDGIIVHPTLHFDEKGHHPNEMKYFVFATSPDLNVEGIIPTFDAFVDHGSTQFPNGLTNFTNQTHVEGYEAMGAISFHEVTLEAHQTITLTLMIGADTSTENIMRMKKTYQNDKNVIQSYLDSDRHIKTYIDQLHYKIASNDITTRLEDVSLQPMYRRFMGNSYMPHHDYGKGGRGWRDLWQDLIALNMYHHKDVFEMLYQYFKGVRLDGSNATIIGDKPGEFKADRNMIARVWSDHGAWPLITLSMYIDETGDLDILLKNQVYFQDHFTHYCQQTTKQPETTFTTYEGTILEHMIIEHVVAINHLGSKGFIKLMDADWNDGLDMGKKQGETIAFTMMYTHHLKRLSDWITALGVETLTLYEPLVNLMNQSIDVNTYFDLCVTSEKSMTVSAKDVSKQLKVLHETMLDHIRKHAFQHEMYQSYISHDGHFLDNDQTVMLTGQAMALLNNIATPEQAISLSKKTREVLYDETLGGYQLNSLYDATKHPLGRAFYFAYHHKENGAVFSHMAMMYAFGLYQYHLVDLGREAYMAILNRALDHDSEVYRGIPEYFNDKGIGKYLYLTGSASWLLYILRRQVFGLAFKLGNLYLEPKLTKDDFMNGEAFIHTLTFGAETTITYLNPKQLAYGAYRVESVMADGQQVTLPITKHYDHIIVELG